MDPSVIGRLAEQTRDLPLAIYYSDVRASAYLDYTYLGLFVGLPSNRPGYESPRTVRIVHGTNCPVGYE